MCIIAVASAAPGLSRTTSAERLPEFLGARVILAGMLLSQDGSRRRFGACSILSALYELH